jgi:hypothetical protein
MSSKSFLRRPEGVGFWTMMIFSLPFALYSYVTTKTSDLGFVIVFFIVGLLVFRTAWVVLGWRRPMRIPMEKVEMVFFWIMLPFSIVLLLSEYVTIFVFSYALFYVFTVGLLSYCLLYLNGKLRSPGRWI